MWLDADMTLPLVKLWDVVKRVTWILPVGIVRYSDMVRPGQEHDDSEDDERPGAVRILCVDVTTHKQAARHQEDGAPEAEAGGQCQGLPRDGLSGGLELRIYKCIVVVFQFLIINISICC